MKRATETSEEKVGIRSIMRLAAPIFAANLAIVLSGTIDTVMAGRLSANDLAGVALGTAIATWISISLAGILQGISPIAGYAFGAKRWQEVGHSLAQCLWLALLLAVPGLFLTLQTEVWVSLAGAGDEVADIARRYLGFAALALPAILFGRAFIAANAAVSRPGASMCVTLGIVALKAPCNHLFMERLELGGAGVGLSLAVLSWSALLAYVLIWKFDPYYRRMHLERWVGPKLKSMGELVRVGFPIGLSIGCEMTSYSLMAIFMARFGAVMLAAHQIVANLIWLYYIPPLAVGLSGTVLISQNLGAKRPEESRRAAKLVLGLALAAALALALVTYLLRRPILSLYSTEADVIRSGFAFITIACFYHIADALQCSAGCILRGYRITLMPMIVQTVCLCGLGLTIGAWLAGFFPWSTMRWGGVSFWYGAATGLTAAAALLVPYALRTARRFAEKPRAA